METLSQFAFVRVYMIASMTAFVWFGMAFPAGAWRGSRVGASVLVFGLWLYVAALVATTLWAISSGEWGRLTTSLGAGVLFEMAVFVMIWQFIMYFMASRYLSDKRVNEMKAASRTTETTHA